MATEIGFYFDEMMSRTVASQLINRGYEIIMAVDVGMVGKDDLTGHLTCATEHGLVLVTHDKPFAGRAMSLPDQTGVLCWTGAPRDYGGMIRAFSSFATQNQPEAIKGRVFWLK